MNPEDLTPVKPIDYLVLLVLGRGDRHGYGIVGDVEAESRGQVRLQPGNLYRIIRRLIRRQLVEESDRRPAKESDDERRRYYRLTPLGRQVMREETDRMRRLVECADRLDLQGERP